jgi:hypothetical protein
MDAYVKYFTRLVVNNAPQIFPGLNRAAATSNTYNLLVQQMRLIAQDDSQARKIAESIESGTEDIFRDFDLSTFMEHFKLDALEKTVLALAFKLGSRPDLKTKGEYPFLFLYLSPKLIPSQLMPYFQLIFPRFSISSPDQMSATATCQPRSLPS